MTKNPDKTAYNPGEQVTLTAVPGSGATFVGWSGSATGTTNPLTIIMDGNKIITATFSGGGGGVTTYTLTVTVSPSGAGTVTRNPNKTSYTAGEQVTLTATANPGYTFSNWSGDATGTTPTTTITVTKNMTVTANFTATGGGTGGGTTTGTVYITDNPVAPGQSVQFRNLKSGDEVKIYNILGQEVTTIKEANGVASWDGKDKNGNPLDSGVYIYKTTKSGAKGKIIVQK